MEARTRDFRTNDILPMVVNSDAFGVHTSLFVSATDGEPFAAVRTKFRNQMAEASQLLRQSMSEDEVRSFLKPLENAFASYRGVEGACGFAFFKSHDAMFHTTLRVAPPDLVVVASSFHIKPLIHCLSSSLDCYVLGATPRKVKVFRLMGDQIDLLKEYANEHEDLEVRSRRRFVGQRKRAKETTERYLRDVMRQLVKDIPLRGKDVAVLGPRTLRKRAITELAQKSGAHVFFESSMFSSVEAMVSAVGTAGNAILKNRSQKIAKQLARTEVGGLITNSLDDIAQAAVQGRIERLVIDPSVQVWGLYDRKNGLVRTHPTQASDRDDCVIDDITEEVIKRGGDVVLFDARDLQNVAPYMATLRW